MTTQTLRQRQIRRGLADAFAFVRSSEANRRIQAVTFNQLLAEQLQRNGETERLNKASNNPYSYDPEANEPASTIPLARANFLSGTDTNNMTKLDRVVFIKNAIGDLVETVKGYDQEELVQPNLGAASEDLFVNTNDPFEIYGAEE